MNKFYKRFTLIALSCFLTLQISAQTFEWKAASFQNRLTPTNQHFDFELLANDAEHQRIGELNSITLPNPNGQAVEFALKPSQVMSPALAAKFPSIKTYNGTNKNGESLKLTLSNKGIHAMVFSNDGLYFIDPIEMKAAIKHQAYFKRDIAFNADKANFQELEPVIYDKEKFTRVQKIVAEKNFSRPPSGNELRTYRIAIAATGEYTSFHGGSVTDGMAAIVTTMARVNGIYERELATTMILVDNNDQLIFTDAAADPFTNNSAGSYIDEVQAEIDDVIGADNYDIGHGFSTGAGGLAGLGVVCQNGRKGSGVTGTNSPIGDPYDVDYVAHEIGHQFGGPHTFNGVNGSCSGGNRNGTTAYEPGSGVTIMAYAGICGADNTANNSIPFFHASSLEYITVFNQEAGGNSCASITEIGNTPPEVEAGAGGFSIPINTPFQLNGSATDADGDNLTYAWEQFDLGPAGTPNSPSGNAPLFRSFVPTTDSFRIFPRLADVINNTQTIGEILPSYARDMSFILTVRDDQAVGGVNNDLISFSVSDVGGPFVVNELTGSYSGLESITVNWDVANTNLSPINCSTVNIYVSDDGGQTFDYLVKEATPNDGIESITLPNINAANAKIKVAAAQNIFFNISGNSFSIAEATDPTFTLANTFDQSNYCPSDNITVEVNSQSVLNYTAPIQLSVANLDAGLTASFSASTINPGESTTLTIANPNGISGSISFNIIGNSGNQEKSIELGTVIVNNPESPEVLSPTTGELVGLFPTIEWSDNNLLTTYDIEIASDENFNNIVESAQDITSQRYTITEKLEATTTYFVSISAKNSCGTSDATIITIETDQIVCKSYVTEDLPVSIATVPTTVESVLEIVDEGKIQSIEVLNVTGSHSYISDLTFILESPDGTQVELLSEVCGSEDNFSFSFSELTGLDQSELPCPPTDGGTYMPKETFSVFNGKEITGEWKLIVVDGYSEDGGALSSWELYFCLTEPKVAPEVPINLTATYTDGLDINLSWSDVLIETAYEVERKLQNAAEFELITTLSANDTVFSTSLEDVGKQFIYRVRAANDNVYSDYSEEVNASIRLLSNKAFNQSNISIFPNPANKLLNIQNNGDLKITKITITDLSGKTMNNIPANAETVNLSGYESGMYIITFQTKDKLFSTHLLIK